MKWMRMNAFWETPWLGTRPCSPGRTMLKKHGESSIQSLVQEPRSWSTIRTPGDQAKSIKESHPPEAGRTRLCRVNPKGDVFMKIEILADADSVAQEAAAIIAA